MDNLILSIFYSASTRLTVAVSCMENEKTLKSDFSTLKVTDLEIKSSIASWYQSNLNDSQTSARIESQEIDFDNLTVTTNSGNTIKTYVANSADYKENAEVNYSIGIYQDGQSPTNALILKTTKESSGISKIDYFNLEGVLLTSLRINSKTEAVEVLYVKSDSISNGRAWYEDCGNTTARCIADLYTNRGWFSVGLFVWSAVDPLVPLSVAAACALHECVIK